MALFGSRPEEPTEWAGLPSEPLEEDDFTKLLPGLPAVADDTLFGGASAGSISISLTDIPLSSPGDSDA